MSSEKSHVFEIGTGLRGTREHRQLELSQVERATRIRAKYLKALEDERFDVLPGTAYLKGFLRTYADYLGLDGQRFVDEYNERFAGTEDVLQATPPVRVLRRRRLDARLVAIPLALALGLVAWRVTAGGEHHPGAAATGLRRALGTSAVSTAPSPAKPRPLSAAQLALVASRGPCWLLVRRGSPTGTIVYEATLARGKTVRFAGARLWIRIGAPWNLDAKMNGRPAQLPGSVGNVVVTRSALQAVGG